MEFCDDCDSILFLKSNVDDSSKSKLMYECKLCGFNKNTKPSEKCIYTRDYSGEYLSYKILTNPYICEDPTLPILNNIDCPNEKCIVNKSSSNMKNNIILKPVMFNNRADIVEIIENILDGEKYERKSEIDTSSDYTITNDQLSLTIGLSPKLKAPKIKKIINKLNKNKLILDYEINITKFKKPERRVTYIKYDKTNMRFIYICTHCNTYWKR